MKYSSPLDQGVFLKRYKRFFADIDWNQSMLTAHVPNTGSMKGVNTPGQPCLFSHSDNPARKLKQTLEMIQAKSGCWVGVNTATPNLIVRECLENVVSSKTSDATPEVFKHWQAFDLVKPEFKISSETRLDFALFKTNADGTSREFRHYIEVKNVTMAEGKTAMFPDSETTRGQKHLMELMKLVEQGHTAEIVFTIQRDDCEQFTPAGEIDSEYARLLREAARKGVRITPLVVQLCPNEAVLTSRMLSLSL